MAREIHVPKSRHDQNDDHPFAPVRKEMIEILLEPVPAKKKVDGCVYHKGIGFTSIVVSSRNPNIEIVSSIQTWIRQLCKTSSRRSGRRIPPYFTDNRSVENGIPFTSQFGDELLNLPMQIHPGIRTLF